MADSGDGIAPFLRAATEEKSKGEPLVVPQWQRTDWVTFFSYARSLEVKSGNVLIEKDASERALYFVASGLLEVTSVLSSHSLGVIAKVHPGSVVGELAFLDGRPRSAKVWAVADSELYQLDFKAYRSFADEHPRKTCDLLFAIGGIVALRLRRSQARVAR